MTRQQALFVKFLRVTCDGSWRWVAYKWRARYEKGLPFNYRPSNGGNQLDGIVLCSTAQTLLQDECNPEWQTNKL